MQLSRINIILGERDAGKSILCAKMVKELIKRGYSLAGIISPGKYDGNTKKGINAINITNGETIELAEYDPGWDSENSKRIWRMNQAAIPWGNKILKKITTCDVLVVDEIGFLEFEKEGGWKQVFKTLEQELVKISFIVVRPELLKYALMHWENANIIELMKQMDVDLVLTEILDQVDKKLAN